jgi:hypothetical protein
MKITFSSFIVLLFIAGMFSCKKDNFNYPKDTVAGSKIIYFATVETKGDRTIYVTQGDAYGDSGAIAKLEGADIQYTTDGSADPSKPGIYNITYSAVNAEGYSVSDWRTVVVIGTDVTANDFSGTYDRYTFDVDGVTHVAFGQKAVWVKTAPGIYAVSNPGGAAGADDLTITAVNYTGNKIAIPRQESADFGGIVSSTSASFTPPSDFQWALSAPGYGTQVRYFEK